MTAPDPSPDAAVEGQRFIEDWMTDNRWPRAYDLSHGIAAALNLAARDAAQQRIGAERALREAADHFRSLGDSLPICAGHVTAELTDRADRIAGSSQSGEGFVPVTCGTCGESVPNPEFEVHECQADIRNSGTVTDRADRIAQEEA